MNHLEPLSWSRALQGDELVAYQREHPLHQHLMANLSLSIRASFRVIRTFFEGCRRARPASCLAASLHAAREVGLITFELAIDGCLIDASLRADCERCLKGLARLADSLLEGQELPTCELAHALDKLIALPVRVEGVASEYAPCTSYLAGVRHESPLPRDGASVPLCEATPEGGWNRYGPAGARELGRRP